MKRICLVGLAALLLLLTACKPLSLSSDKATVTIGETYTDYKGMEIGIRNLVWNDEEIKLEIDLINSTSFDVTYGDRFDIEREANGEWKSAVAVDNLAFNAIGYLQKAGSVRTKTYVLTDTFDISKSGRYRFVTDCFVSDKGTDGKSTKCVMRAEFTVNRVGNTNDVRKTFVDFYPLYVRTDGYHEDAEYPTATVVRSVEELNAYRAANKERYDFTSQRTPHGDAVVSFTDICQQYDDAYFEKQVLVMVLLEEGSGSITHHVDNVALGADGKLYVSIRRIVPEVGTCDMAQWHILIEPEADIDATDVVVRLNRVNEEAVG